jgi:hypothetical protein
MAYLTGSQQHRWLESKAIRAGQRVSDGGERVPVGTVHAVEDVTHRAACGAGVMPCVFEDMPWQHRSMVEHCRECESLVPFE